MTFSADFGPTARDYATFRAGFPPECFTRLKALRIGLEGQHIADIGTGTGTLARGLAHGGARLVGIDPKPAILEAARRMAMEEGLEIAFRPGTAERTGLVAGGFDAVVAGQCWHWFDGNAAFAETTRLLKPDGLLAICHYDCCRCPAASPPRRKR